MQPTLKPCLHPLPRQRLSGSGPRAGVRAGNSISSLRRGNQRSSGTKRHTTTDSVINNGNHNAIMTFSPQFLRGEKIYPVPGGPKRIARENRVIRLAPPSVLPGRSDSIVKEPYSALCSKNRKSQITNSRGFLLPVVSVPEHQRLKPWHIPVWSSSFSSLFFSERGQVSDISVGQCSQGADHRATPQHLRNQESSKDR